VNNLNALVHRPVLSTGFLILVSFLLVATEPGLFALEGNPSPGRKAVRADPEILKGIDLIYDHRFDDAEDLFERVIARHPDKPVGYFYLAMVSWSRLASGFWSPDIVQEFKDRIDRTIDMAEALAGKKMAGSYDFFYLGGALGFKGRFELMKGNWVSSFFLATDAIDALKRCLEMDPDNKDVLLGIGTFDYYTARLSGVLKFLTYLLLHKGNKEEGLKKLNIAANEAIYSATESKSLLLHVYLFLEQDFDNALIVSSELAKKYPENPRFKFFQGVSCIRLKMYPKYEETVNELRQRSAEASKREKVAMWERQALYLEATYALFQGRTSEARSILKKILDHPDPVNDPSMIAWPRIKIGMSYDLDKNREKAVGYYNDVLNMENGSGAQFLAKKLLEGPLGKEDPFIGY
jgi:tetratricopeptide (TPR) repeat protein